ncbi:MAG: glycosyltransferase family 4 protein [Candidatus Dormibacteria bacterium]
MNKAPLRIAMHAPPWKSIPPHGYGAIEEVVRLLCIGLVRRGHRVSLFAPPGSASPADVHPVLEQAWPNGREISDVFEIDHVARIFDAMDAAALAGDPFDVIHDHNAYAALAMGNRAPAPIVHTVHWRFFEANTPFYRAHGHKGVVVCLSHAQAEGAPAELGEVHVVPNPIDVDEWPLSVEPGKYLLWMARICDEKGTDLAIEAAQRAGIPLVLAGPVRQSRDRTFLEERVLPLVDGERVRWVGEVAGRAKADLLAGARALLVPSRWDEPFGLVMAEAMACGTPVIALPAGAARELVIHGINGFLVNDVGAMADAIARACDIDRPACRRSVAERFSVEIVIEAYERLYRRAIAESAVGRPEDR